MRSEPERRSAQASRQPQFGTAAFVALGIPLLGMIGVFVAIGWRLGPWPPLGIAGVVALLLVVTRWRRRADRKLYEIDPVAGRKALDARAARAGSLMGRAIALWVLCSIAFVVLLLASRF